MNSSYLEIDTDSGGTGLVTVPLYAGDRRLLFVIDTGANVSCLEKAVADTVKLKERKPYGNTVSGVGGDLGTDEKARLILHSGIFAFDQDFMVGDLNDFMSKIVEAGCPKPDGMLGTDFLSRYRCHLDFKKSRLHFG